VPDGKKTMIALFSLLTILTVSIIVVRVGAVALSLTGLSEEVASFQAQSAFSGVGFTTAESESIVTNPGRRKIIRALMLLGSAGITSSIATLVLTFVGQSPRSTVLRGGALLAGLLVIFLLARSAYLYRVMKKVITRALDRWTKLRLMDYEQVLGLSRGYTIFRIKVRPHSWLSRRKLSELNLGKEGILVLGIYRQVEGEEKFIGIPTGDTVIQPEDVLVCYSRERTGIDLARRDQNERGAREHRENVEEEKRRIKARELRGGFE